MLMCELEPMEYMVTMETLMLEGDIEFDIDDDIEDEPYFEEYGFNPYMGCYDFDCQSKS